MPVNSTSRYAGLSPYNVVDADGVTHATLPLRSQPLPPAGSFTVPLTGVDSVESLAARHLGGSDFWWRIADANPLVFPLDLRPGALITVPATADAALIVRERSFGR